MIDLTRTVRKICLALPEATERETWGGPTFRVGEKIFAIVQPEDGRMSLWIKAEDGLQQSLIATDPDRYFSPPYLGGKGWVGIRLDGPLTRDELADHITGSYELVAPKRLRRLL